MRESIIDDNIKDLQWRVLVRIGIAVFKEFGAMARSCLVNGVFWFRARSTKRVPPIRDPLLLRSATDLAAAIRNRELTSEIVTCAHINRIQEVNPLLNAVVEDRCKAALEEAREWDRKISAADKDGNGEDLFRGRPLLGVPFTVKESCSLEGLSNAVGCLEFVGRRCTKDGEAVRLVKEAGAIPLLVSNTPELCLGWESTNLLNGTTNNPYCLNRTPGGSSGGEAALLACGATPISVSSDIAGSIRIPAAFCGVFGHKPSPGIIPIEGHIPTLTDENYSKFLVVGPMSKHAEDLPLLMSIMGGENCRKLRLDQPVDISKLRVFYATEATHSCALIDVEPCLKETVRSAAEYLQQCGAELCYDNFEDLEDSVEMSVSVFFSMKDIPNMLQDPANPKQDKNLVTELVKYMFGGGSRSLQGLGFSLIHKTNLFIPENRTQYYYEKTQRLKQHLQDLLGDDGVLLYPVHSSRAHRHGEVYVRTSGVTYTMLYNVLGLPATAVPCGLCGGLPLSMQVIAAPNQDRLCLAVAKELEKGFVPELNTKGFTMADQVDSMSDAELRTKLAEHGFPVMPITASTRKLLVKKLKMVLDNKTSRNSVDSKVKNRRSLARYSSDEEADTDTTSVQEKRGRRATTGGAMLPPATSKTRRTPVKKTSPKRDSDGSESEEEKSPVRTHEEVETVTTRRVTRTYANDVDDFETGSDSDVDAEKKTSSPFRSSSRSSDYISSTLPTHDTSTSPPKTSVFSRPSLSTNYSPVSPSDHLNLIRSRLGLTSTLGDRPSSNFSSTFSSSTSNYQPSTATYQPSSYKPLGSFTPSTSTYQSNLSSVDEVESPYLSNFTRRLSALKAEPPKPTSFIDRDATNGSTMLPRRSYISGVSRADVADYKTANDKNFLKNNLVSLALVVVDDQNSVFPICQLNIPGNRPGINCVPKEQVSYAKNLLKVIHPELTSRAAAYKCGKPGIMPYMTEREILDIARVRADAIDDSQCRIDLNNLQVLLVHNPRWGINVVQLKALYTKDVEYFPLMSTDVVVQQRNKGFLALALSDPSTPVSCLFVNTLYSAGSTFIIIGVIAVSMLGAQKCYKMYVNYQKKKSEEIYSMVEQIIDVISQETENSGEPYISVDHVRDTLISPQNREKMSSVWDAAIKFIQKNESRVRMEVQSVDGEDCRVWRWIASHNSPKRSAAWQGQAFETQEGSVNNLTVSPSPCLKIRSMFEKNDTNPNLATVIQDVILEKCDNCNILHIDIERASCCVYVKCATPTDAGVVYKSLHGWWYEGRLITVKYLRLERYMQRFPNSPSSGPYLTPSRQRKWDE
ncbi:unnamed protein product [Leptosia nina]|uniref:LEM domain-containing protein n=1 Tax=Leptosia nina TaxID=320188 RepID=A0AAV1JCU0_9NEOP